VYARKLTLTKVAGSSQVDLGCVRISLAAMIVVKTVPIVPTMAALARQVVVEGLTGCAVAALKTMVERSHRAAGLEHDPLTVRCPRQRRRNRVWQYRSVSRTMPPSRSTTQTCVSFIETSSPAKCSMAALLSHWGANRIGLPKSSRLITPCCKSRLPR
jgi:hypothetical protein